MRTLRNARRIQSQTPGFPAITSIECSSRSFCKSRENRLRELSINLFAYKQTGSTCLSFVNFWSFFFVVRTREIPSERVEFGRKLMARFKISVQYVVRAVLFPSGVLWRGRFAQFNWYYWLINVQQYNVVLYFYVWH